MNGMAYRIHPKAAHLQRLQKTILSFRLLPLLLLVPLAVILMRVFVWSVPPFLTNILVGNACLILLFVIGRVLLVLEETRGGMVPRPVTLRKNRSGQLRLAAGREEDIESAIRGMGYAYIPAILQGARWSRMTICGLVAIVAGMLLVIPTGVYDYLHQFSGLTYVGLGDPVALNDEANYGFYSKGPLASYSELAYKIRGYPLFLPSRTFPEGAKELSILDLSGKELWAGILEPGKRHVEGKYIFHFDNFVYDAFLAITTKENHYIIGEFVRCRYMKKPDPPYTHYGIFQNEQVKGEAWYDPVEDRVRVRATIKGKKIEAVVGMGPEHVKEVDGFMVTNNGIGKWSQVNVMRTRHLGFMKVGSLLFLAGILFYLLSPIKRVWLDCDDDGLLVTTNDLALKKRLAGFTGGVACE